MVYGLRDPTLATEKQENKVKRGLRRSCLEVALAVTEGQRVSLATLCAAPERGVLAQRVDSVPADLPVPWHEGEGSASTPQRPIVLVDNLHPPHQA